MVAQIDKTYVGLGLGRTARRFVSYLLFEGRPATTRGQWFNPVVFAWLRLLAALPGGGRVTEPIFITGLGRSGTTILGLLLSLHKDVGFLNEPKALWHVVDPRQDVNGNYSDGIGIYRLTDAHCSPSNHMRAHRLFSRYLKMVGARRVVDKYPELIFRIPYLKALFPDSRIIFIQRNGVDACRSIVRWSERLGMVTEDGVEDWWGRNDSKWLTLWSELVVADPYFKDLSVWDPAEVGHPDRAAIEWIVTMREGLRQSRLNPDGFVRVTYESLLADPETELARLLSACGLERDESMFSYARARLYENPGKSKLALHPLVQCLFDETMVHLGYSPATDDLREAVG